MESLEMTSVVDTDSSNYFVATQNEEVATLEEFFFSEGNLDQNPSSSQGVQNVRRSSRQSVFPKNYNNFVVESKVKYGLEKYVGRKVIGSKWIYKIKFKSSGEIDRYKARLVAQGFGQKEGIDYEETFSCVVKMSDKGVFLALLVYVDDIIITGNSVSEIEKFKVFLKSKFMIKDLGKLKYFLGIEVVDTDKDISKSCPGLKVFILRKHLVLFLTAYSDVDWAKCIVTRKSVTGNSAIKIDANPVFHERRKHLEIDLHFVREKVLKGVVNQIANILTKGLDTVQHLELVKNLGMYDVYQVETKGGY
ncbi:ribonuclease H-like domain-containing protein [Tanacetum coccineum]